MMGLQWHQLDYIQIICTLLQTYNHTSISPLHLTTKQCTTVQHTSIAIVKRNIKKNEITYITHSDKLLNKCVSRLARRIPHHMALSNAAARS